jgi:hypothetical protein
MWQRLYRYTDVIMVLRWENYPGLKRWVLNVTTCTLNKRKLNIQRREGKVTESDLATHQGNQKI